MGKYSFYILNFILSSNILKYPALILLILAILPIIFDESKLSINMLAVGYIILIFVIFMIFKIFIFIFLIKRVPKRSYTYDFFKKFAKDKKFWDDQLDALGEPLYSDIQGPSVLEGARKRHGDPKLRASDIEMNELFVAVKDYHLEPYATQNLMDFCMNHQLSMTNLLLLGIRTYLSKVNNGQEDITIQNFISRRSTHDEWTSGGSRTIMFPCRTVISPETDFLSAAYEIQNMQNRIYMHSNYDPTLIVDEMRKRYHTPEHTSYESCYLTYQPMPVKVENEMLGTVRQHAKWFANGAATKKMYLTVSHTEDGGMNFSYHYQTAHLEEHDMELLYYYMMRILFKGIAEPDMSIGEIMEQV